MRGNATRFPDKQLSNTAARTQLVMLLSNATDERLFAFTVAGLSGTHRLHGDHRRNEREIEAMLSARVAARRRQIAEAGDPRPCSGCAGQGKVTRYRIDDRSYPATCSTCNGSGVARA